jgi:hypothetical protein
LNSPFTSAWALNVGAGFPTSVAMNSSYSLRFRSIEPITG